MKSFGAGIKVLCFSWMIFTGCNSQVGKKEAEPMPGDNPEREQYLDWFREAKFGMFIHWGPYSCYGGEWNGRQVPVGRGAEWIMKILEIPAEEYRESARRMNPVRFNAREYVQLAKEAGMKYIVITAKHHDGFAMYHSRVTPYNIYDWTPFKRDPLKELAEACAEERIKFCLYYSHREDWDHPGGYGNSWDYDNDWGSVLFNHSSFEKYLEEKAKPQLRELLTNYGPVGLVWFDRGMFTKDQGLEFVRLVHDLQPSTLINGRVGNYDQELLGDYQCMSDNGMPPGGLGEYWETPQTLNKTWGYSKFDTLWKSPEKVIINLVEIVSRGGNYLLNIGPKGDGEIPDTTISIFRKVGQWMERNSESIYGTTANPFGELPWGYCTVRENKLYLMIRDWPQNRMLTLPELQNKVESAYLLIDKPAKLQVIQDDHGTTVSLPSEAPDKPVSVVVLEIRGALKHKPQIVLPDETGKIMLDYLTANPRGKAVTRFNRKGGFHISKWSGPEDAVEWRIKTGMPGKYRVCVTYSANKAWEGSPFEISIGNYAFVPSVLCTGDVFEFQEFTVGYADLSGPGEYTVTIRPKQPGDHNLMYLQSISLHPVEKIKTEGWGVN